MQVIRENEDKKKLIDALTKGYMDGFGAEIHLDALRLVHEYDCVEPYMIADYLNEITNEGKSKAFSFF